MKNLVVLFAGGDMTHAFEPIFDGKTAFDCACFWAQTVSENAGDKNAGVSVFTVPEYKERIEAAFGAKKTDVVVREQWTNAAVAREISAACTRHDARCAVFAWADSPFLNAALTEELIRIQTEYKAEYSFADGFAYGLAPEVIDRGCAGIVAALGEDSQKTAGEKPASRDALFSIMSGDINSFEIETHIADKDYRLLRFSFECGSKASALGCKRLYESAKKGKLLSKITDAPSCNVYTLSDLAEKDVSVLKTLPAFYNVQLSGSYSHALVYAPIPALPSAQNMDIGAFSALVKDIAQTSERAVVSLSLFGEPLLHPQFADAVSEVLRYPGLTVFVETDGVLVTEELASRIAASCPDAEKRVIWCVLLDAQTAPVYGAVHGIGDGEKAAADFAAAQAAVAVLAAHFPHAVYPQFTRMKVNEPELEAFYRYWKKADSPSRGELIIQKYDRFCGLLPDAKSADLSPLERMPCWHLRRDFCVLSDGTVPFCRSAACATGCASAGNVLQEGIQTVWERFNTPLEAHISQSYNEVCKVCDEYYTFNF
ncbi:MAG: spiro-SPASM protein [Treponema sp.]|nr:spiro-SPASM protein [Treponema sp.]